MQQFAQRRVSSTPIRLSILGLSHVGIMLSLVFLITTITSFAQDSDSKQLAFSETKIQFEKELGAEQKGVGTYIYSTRDNNTIEAKYDFEKSSTPNPYKISYSYNITKGEDGALAIDLSSIIDPIEMRIDESMEIRSSNDKVEYPSNLSSGDKLKDVNGQISLYSKQGKLFLIYTVSISNRSVDRKETISIGNSSVEAFVISYDYKFEKTNKFDVTLQKSKQKVEEWFLPGVGVIKQNRSGEDITQSFSDEGNAGSVNFINTTSNIKHIDQY